MVVNLIGALFFCPMMTYGCEEALNSKERNRRKGIEDMVLIDLCAYRKMESSNYHEEGSSPQ
jgi:hypothetical protein